MDPEQSTHCDLRSLRVVREIMEMLVYDMKREPPGLPEMPDNGEVSMDSATRMASTLIQWAIWNKASGAEVSRDRSSAVFRLMDMPDREVSLPARVFPRLVGRFLSMSKDPWPDSYEGSLGVVYLDERYDVRFRAEDNRLVVWVDSAPRDEPYERPRPPR